jgi:hypothetical protein
MQKNDISRNDTPHTTIHCVQGKILEPEEINVTCEIVTQVGTMDRFLVYAKSVRVPKLVHFSNGLKGTIKQMSLQNTYLPVTSD